MWKVLAETSWFCRLWLSLGVGLLGYLVGNIVGFLGGDLLGLISEEQQAHIAPLAAFPVGAITFALCFSADTIDKRRNVSKHLATVGERHQEKILNMRMLEGFAVLPYISHVKLGFLNEMPYHMIVTDKRLLFLRPSPFVWFGAAGEIVIAVVGAKGYLKRHGKTEGSDELEPHVLKSLLNACPYFTGYLGSEIRDIRILKDETTFEFEIETTGGRRNKFALDLETSKRFKGELRSSLQKLKATVSA